MKVLLVYPRYPQSIWSFGKSLKLAGRKAMFPPLGLITVAALLPGEWEFRLRDRNIGEIAEADWDWAELVMISGMIAQRDDFIAQIGAAKARGKHVVVGGPYPTALPQELADAGADFIVRGEAESTLPSWLAAFQAGAGSGIFESEDKPDVTRTPPPRYDLLDLDAYTLMAAQFSRGCPFLCEFCDIIVMFGRKPRTKTPEQMLAELQRLYDLGWRERPVFLVDDNFVGNKREAKRLLQALIPWMRERGYPFPLFTEASVDLARHPDLMDAMVQAGFSTVFVGIETPDADSLDAIRKVQNTRAPLIESVHAIARSGLRVTASFIIGFDGERAGAGRRIVDFVEAAAISTAQFNMLQALPGTALWQRLEKEGRLRADKMNYRNVALANFVPTRPLAELAGEYVDAYQRLYDPIRAMDRAYRQACAVESAPHCRERGRFKKAHRGQTRLDPVVLRVIASICWQQGVVRETRFRFWRHLFDLARSRPYAILAFLTYCFEIEHFVAYRAIVKQQIEAQSRDWRQPTKGQKT